MKNEKLKTMLLPIGLFVTSFSLMARFIHIELPDVVDGFFKGVGITLIVMAILTQKCENSPSK
jgi:hypothetical protein